MEGRLRNPRLHFAGSRHYHPSASRHSFPVGRHQPDPPRRKGRTPMTRTPTHAGVVTFRDGAQGRLFLVVSAKKRPDRRVLPKGHIEPEESIEAAALRELGEEAGVAGEIVTSLGYPQLWGSKEASGSRSLPHRSGDYRAKSGLDNRVSRRDSLSHTVSSSGFSVPDV